MNILVTGASGFIGTNFIPKLIENNHNVTLLVRNIEKAKRKFQDKVNYIVGDVTKKETLIDCCKDIDIVYHLVAKVGNQLPNKKNNEEFDYINVQGTKNIVSEAKKYNVKKFIYVSSIAAIGIVKKCPINEKSKASPYLPYQTSKYKTEKYLLSEYEQCEFPVIILRPTKVYGIGANENVYLTQIKLCKKGINLLVGMGENYISNIHIKDFCKALLNCIEYGKTGEIYILSGPDSISGKDVGKIIENRINTKVHNVRVPKYLMMSLAFLEERLLLFLNKKPIVTLKNIEATSYDRIYDLEKAKKELNYDPTISMKKGMTEMIDYYMENKII